MDLHAVSCFLILLTCTGVCFGQELILPERMNGTVGGDVLFTPLKIPDPPPTISSWRFNGALIISAQPSGTTITDSYQGRVSFNTFTLALALRSLTESDTGQYTLTVQTDKGNITAQTSLQVLVPVSNIIIIPSNTELVEFNSTVSLVCSASGSSPSFIWLNGSSEVTAGERVQLTNSNSNLIITSVMRGDTGPYQCEASNSFSNAKSPPLSLTIYYGPENVRVISAPVGPSYSSGSNLILTCSADASPAAEFQWAVNGTELGEMGQELRLSNIQSSHSGNYICMAHNKQSLRYSTSEPISITVLGMSFGQEVILPQRISGTVGGNVLFTPLKIPDLPHTITSWRFNGALIITVQPSGTTIQDSYQGRVSFNTFTLALALRSLTESDTGQYTLTVQNDKGTFTAQTSLQVLGRHTDGGGDSLSGEAIARIVIVVLLGVAGIAGLIFYFVKNKCQK